MHGSFLGRMVRWPGIHSHPHKHGGLQGSIDLLGLSCKRDCPGGSGVVQMRKRKRVLGRLVSLGGLQRGLGRIQRCSHLVGWKHVCR